MKENKVAIVRKPLKISLVWLIPVLAVAITATLLWKNTFDRGELVTLYCEDASGMEAGKTLVKFRSVTVGKVEKVLLSSDHSKVELKVRIEESERDLLRQDSSFYVIKPRVQSANISGLDTILSGNYIQLVQGVSKEHGSEFVLLDSIPAVIGDPNTLELTLISSSSRRIAYGDPVSYRGFVVGNVKNVELDPERGDIKYKISIDPKYRGLVSARSVFWINSGLDLSMGVQGISFRTETLQNLLSSGITFDDLNDHEPKAKQRSVLRLYEDFKEACASILENRPHFVLMVDSRAGVVPEGGVVKAKGMVIGRVVDSPWYDHPDSLLSEKEEVPIRIALAVKGISDEKILILIKQALKKGRLCASIASSSLLTGLDTVRLDFGKRKQCKNTVTTYRGELVIPVDKVQTMETQLESLIDAIGKVDFKGISDDIKRDLSTLNTLMKEWKNVGEDLRTSGLIKQIVNVSEELEQTLQKINGNEMDAQKQGLIDDLRDFSLDIKGMLNELRPGVIQMSQKPNSLIFDHNQEDPEPGSVK